MAAPAGVVTTLLNAVSQAGAGSTVQPDKTARVYQITITGTATVAIEASCDDSNWVTLASVTASGGYESTAPWPYVRANVTSYTSGTVTVLMAA